MGALGRYANRQPAGPGTDDSEIEHQRATVTSLR